MTGLTERAFLENFDKEIDLLPSIRKDPSLKQCILDICAETLFEPEEYITQYYSFEQKLDDLIPAKEPQEPIVATMLDQLLYLRDRQIMHDERALKNTVMFLFVDNLRNKMIADNAPLRTQHTFSDLVAKG